MSRITVGEKETNAAVWAVWIGTGVVALALIYPLFGRGNDLAGDAELTSAPMVIRPASSSPAGNATATTAP